MMYEGVTLEEFEAYLKSRGYSDVYIKEMMRYFKRLAKGDPTIERSKSSRVKASQVKHHIKSMRVWVEVYGVEETL